MTEVPRRVSIPHVPALDGLRGAAVVGVLLYHGGHLDGGYLGVDLFLVLSGYLITSLLLAEVRRDQSVSLGGFWARRARRLLPALALLLVGVAIYCVYFASAAELHRIRGDALATMAYVANWRAIFAHQSYSELFLRPSPLQHTWSLAIEEQFYIVWPLVTAGIVTFRPRRTQRIVLVVALALGTASALLMMGLYHGTNADRVYYGTDTRAFALFAGIALAALVADGRVAHQRWTRGAIEVIGLLALAVLAWQWAYLDLQSPGLYRGGFAIAGVSAALLLLAAVQPTRGPIATALSFAPLRWLGLISYGLYLWHWPVDVVLDGNRTGLTGWSLFVVQTAVAVGIACGSYFAVERPIRRGALRGRQWRVITPAVAAALVLAIVITTSAPATPDAEAATDARAHPTDVPSVPGDRLDVAGSVSQTALQSASRRLDRLVRPGAPRVLLTGDSMAFNLGLGADRHRDAPLAVQSAAMRACGLGPGTAVGVKYATPPTVCEQWPSVWERAIRIGRPNAVVLFSGIYEPWPHIVGKRRVEWSSPEWRRSFIAQLDRARGIAHRAGIPLVLLTVPCLAPSVFGDPAPSSNGDSEQARWLNTIYTDFAARHAGVDLVPLGRHLCGAPASDFVDSVHLSEPGAERAWRWLTPRLQQVLAPHA